MGTVRLKTATIEIDMATGPDVRDITPRLIDFVKGSRAMDGQLSLSAVGSTASVTTIEFEPGVVEDLKRAIRELAPPGREYRHDLAWQDGNGHSHVQAALLGPSLSVPLRGGRLSLGTWQQVVLINHDNRPRKRRVEVTAVFSIPKGG